MAGPLGSGLSPDQETVDQIAGSTLEVGKEGGVVDSDNKRESQTGQPDGPIMNPSPIPDFADQPPGR